MINNKYPIGKPVWLRWKTPRVSLDDFFGFVEVTVTAPNNLYAPLLPFRTDQGIVYATGTFRGVYFTEELKAYEKYGYKYEIHCGYIYPDYYTSTTVFNSYVETLFDKRMEAINSNPPNTPPGFVIKLL